MIYEYALEPRLVATWVDRKIGRYFIERFGLGQPRVVSRYPRRWKRLVCEALTSDNDVERARLTELLVRLGERMVLHRDSVWDPGRCWLENAEDECARAPFRAILARANPQQHPQVLVADEIDGESFLWSVPKGVKVARQATSMAAAVESMLRIAGTVIFVDPHFRPHELRYRRPLEEFLQSLIGERPSGAPVRIEVLTSADGPTADFFARECRSRLPRCIPTGIRVTFCRLRQFGGKERLHNRYILTDHGGVIFGVGLDEGEEGESDDLNLMDRKQYESRWEQYAGDSRAFDATEAAVEIEGKKAAESANRGNPARPPVS